MCALGLLFDLVALVLLADASRPDPTWIPGIYDGADFDEAVVAVVSASAMVETPVLPAKPADKAAGMVQPNDTVFGAAAPSLFSIRAPPVAALITTT